MISKTELIPGNFYKWKSSKNHSMYFNHYFHVEFICELDGGKYFEFKLLSDNSVLRLSTLVDIYANQLNELPLFDGEGDEE